MSKITTVIPETQQGLWLLQTQHENCVAYNVTGALRLEGVLDVAALVAAVTATACRHDSLRSVFPVEEGCPRRRIRPDTNELVSVRDLSSHDAATQQSAVSAEIDTAVDRRFDLARGPLFMLRLLRLRLDEHIMIMSAHHIVADGWSMDAIYRDLSASYQRMVSGGSSSSARPQADYGDLADGLRRRLESGELETSRQYWADRLSGLPAEIRFQGSGERPAAQSFAGDGYEFTLDDDLALRIREIAKRAGATMFTTLLAVFGLTVSSLCGRSSFPIGIMGANRDRPETAGVVGMLANLLPVRLDVNPRAPFAELLRYTREEVLRAREHQEYPFGRIVEEMAGRGAAGAPPIVQVMFDLEYRPSEPLNLPGVAVTLLPVPVRSSKFDLSLIVRDTGGRLEHLIEFDSALLDREWTARFAATYRDVAEAAVSYPGVPVGRLISIHHPDAAPVPDAPIPDGKCAAGIDADGPVPANHGIETIVLGVCADLLRDQAISLDDNFFEAGGNSLLAMRLVYELYRKTGVKAPMSGVVRASTVRELAVTVAGLKASGSSPASEPGP